MKRLFFISTLAAVAVLIALYLILLWKNPATNNQEIVIFVPKGSTITSLSDSLAKYNLIRSKVTFKLAARLTGGSSNLQPGSYRIHYGLSNSEIISRLLGTEFAILFEATFPEGSTIRKIASIAKEKLGLDSALVFKVAHDTAFLSTLGIPRQAKSAEGFLFPDTYRFYLMMTPQELLKRMTARFKEILPDSLLATASSIGMTKYQLITFASIIEAEARRADEREIISGVYYNRLKIGMKLEADPTIQYGLGLTRQITHEDLLKHNLYNTYQIVGLPPGPINNPGKAAVIAALHPAHHDKLFFVAKSDGSGGHYFSHNYGEQQQMIKKSNKNESQ